MKNTFSTVNPTTGETLLNYNYATDAQADTALLQSQSAFENWSKSSLQDRQAKLFQLIQVLKIEREILANTMSLEMGKPILQGVAEVEKCIQLIEFCIEASKTALAVQQHKGFEVHCAPQGIIFGIMPWNFPLWQVFRFVIPTLLVGNTVVVKHAECVAGIAQKIEEIFNKAGLPHIYKNVYLKHQDTPRMIASSLVRGVSLTGSTRAGKSVAETAGKFLKKVVLELGGNDAYIICEDADLKFAAQKVFQARILNAGQSCISAKRIIVHKNIIEPLTELLIDHLEKLQVGDPLLNLTDLGPIARKDLQQGLQSQLEKVIQLGAKLKYTKKISVTKGYFFAPVIIHQDANIHFNEEIFGPIFTMISFSSDSEALQIANSTPYGLGGAVFSRDRERAYSLAKAMDTGSVAVNDFFRSAPERPFGGVKDSGYGRELGEEGFYEFVNKKVIVKSE